MTQNVSRSMSQNTGVAPVGAIASALAKNVNEGTTTSSPGPTPMARSAIVIASVPLATPIACSTPSSCANSVSNAATFGPRMNAELSTTSLIAARISARSGASGVRVSKSSTGTPGRIAPAHSGSAGSAGTFTELADVLRGIAATGRSRMGV